MNAFSNLVSRLPVLYDAAYSHENWRASLDVFSDETEAIGVNLYSFGQFSELAYETSSSNSLYCGYEDILAEYNRRFLKTVDRIGIAKVSDAAPFEAVFDTDIWPLEVLQARTDIRLAREIFSIFRRFTVNLSQEKYLQSGVVLQFPDHIKNIGQHNVDRAQFLAPHLAKAMDINRFHQPLRMKYKAVLAVLDRIDLGICILSPAGNVILANKCAQDSFSGHDGMWIGRDQRVLCRNPDETSRLQQAVAHVSRTADGQGTNTGEQIAISRGSSEEPMLAILSPLRDSEAELETHLTGCMLTLVDPGQASQARVAAFGGIYGLSPAEMNVAELLTQGLSSREIADIRDVGQATVITQVKSILAKTGTKSRVEFLWRVFQFSPPIL